jgi:phage major head subunit gpT-like protein
MGAASLGSRAIIGRFYKTLEQDPGMSWINDISMYFASDQSSEEYRWLGQTPAMREWVGGRHAKGFRDNGLTIVNKHYEATLEVPVRDMKRDKTGQVMTRIDELALRTNAHWASLLTTLIVNGESAVCYDGQYFFDTDHVEGANSTSQSNDLSIDISALPTSAHGSTTAPSTGEMGLCIQQAVSAILGFKDDQNEPMNENASRFAVMVPVSLYNVAVAATVLPFVDNGNSNVIPAQRKFTIDVVPNARLSWTTQFAVFRTDGSVKPFIRQEEEAVTLKAKAEGSEFEFDHDAHQYGVDTWRNVGYGYWQHGCLVTMT